jgi:hypothetical protein
MVFSSEGYTPLGVLPSAGRLVLGSCYLWLNLVIELAVLLPVPAVFIAMTRQVANCSIIRKAIYVFTVWPVFLVGLIGLQR